MSIRDLRVRLEREKGGFSQVEKDISQSKSVLFNLQIQGVDIEQSTVILQIVAQQTQSQLSFYISDMVTAAIEAVFPDDRYFFQIEFVQRRGKTEADLFLEDAQGNRIKPSDAEGGGLVNVVAFALRVALWSLTKQSRAVFVLDEPFMFLHSRDAHAKVAELLSSISERLGLQIIMVTGEDESQEIIEGANKVIRIKKTKGVSAIN